MCNIIGDLAFMFSAGLSVAVGGGRYLHGPSHWVPSELSLIKVALSDSSLGKRNNDGIFNECLLFI